MKYSQSILFLVIIILLGCSSDEKPIDILFSAPNGAILSNEIVGSDNFIISDASSRIFTEARINDQEEGDFTDFIRVYISFKSNSSNGLNDRDEVLMEDIPSSDFFRGEFDRPRIQLNYSFQEALDAFQLTINDVAAGDQFFIRPDIHLRDGRVIGFTNRSPSIIADFCEYSPFLYQINVINPLQNDAFTGLYTYELISSSNPDFADESGITTISTGNYANQRRSTFLDFTVAGDFILPDIYQERGGTCRFGQQIVFWGPQEANFGLLDNQDDSVFEADFVIGYDGWVGGDLTDEPILVRYRFSKQ